MWIGRTPLATECNICSGLKFALLAALFQAAEGSPDEGAATSAVRLKARVQQTPALMLWKKGANQGFAAFGISSHCCAYLNFAASSGSSHSECLPTPLDAQKMGMTPKPASRITYPAVITMEKENSREKDNTQIKWWDARSTHFCAS